jgi:hypothetical protein
MGIFNGMRIYVYVVGISVLWGYVNISQVVFISYGDIGVYYCNILMV